ncbi:unnamed protein product [Mytilus coruscus]|uniref:Uncharacterized protein n=1 Tax=Mytilus coruscus TaxID=42192 RepID=A0A6J8CR57_MYTCO|nr:unnamed protein product [Mytilus coruscus]
MTPIPVPPSTWKKIAIDLTGPYNDKTGKPLFNCDVLDGSLFFTQSTFKEIDTEDEIEIIEQYIQEQNDQEDETQNKRPKRKCRDKKRQSKNLPVMEHRDAPELVVVLSKDDIACSLTINCDSQGITKTNTYSCSTHHTSPYREVQVMEQRDALEVAVLSDDEIAGSLTINSDGQEINETHTNRQNCLWSIIFSWIVLPTTAGNLLPGENESQHSRDGKISSLVALKTAVGILVVLIALGSEVFFGLNFAASVDKVEKQTVLYTVNNVLQFITTFVQTVLIIQMKDYKTINDVSVSATFLFLALVNFGLWLYDTFLETVYFDHLYYTTLYYGQTTTMTIRHLFVPMVIFYRFKCFLSFFELSAFTPPFVDRLLGAVDKMKRKVCCQRQQSYEEI